jgi:alpha-tubulin suppressor-like RCC1 family protein
MRDGTVECWGRNDHCDLGDGTNVDSTQPKPVVGVVDATAIATGLWQACAVLASSGLRCWGANDRGQLGNGTSDPICEPTTVLGLDGSGSKVLAVSPAEDHGCAVLADGEVRCFGSNDYGQLGAAQFSATNSPVSCALAQPADLIAAGIWYTCAALRDRTVVCLGKGDVGQLGNGNLEPSLSPVPVALPAGTTLKSMATKYHHTCAVDQQGQIWCWGANEMGQLGNGATVDSSVPVLARISHKL